MSLTKTTYRFLFTIVLVACALALAQAQTTISELDSLVQEAETPGPELVEVGYEQVARHTIGGAVYTVGESLQRPSRINFLEGIQGMVPGMNAIQTSGQPMGEMSLQVRGIRSLAAGNEPLYIIDGFPLYNDNFRSSSHVTVGPNMDMMAMFNPEDVESITFLKDASTKAIYGGRGANGVVVINTKQGVANTSRIDLSVTAGFQNPIANYDLLDGQTFASYLNESRVNAGLSPLYSDPSSFGSGTDWQSESQTGSSAVQNYLVRFSGGSGSTRYMISGAYSGQDGHYNSDGVRRGTLHANIISQARSNVVIRNSFNASRVSYNTSNSDVSIPQASPGIPGASFMFNPLLGVRDTAGNFTVLNNVVGNNGLPTDQLQTDFALLSPVAQSAYTQSELINTRFTNYLSLDYNFLPEFTLRIAGGVDALFNEEAVFASSALNPDATLGGFGASAKLQNLNWVNEYTLKYNKQLRESDELTALVGFSMQGYTSELLNAQSEGFENESLGFYNLSVGQNKSIDSYLLEWQMVSFFTRIRYSLNNRFHFAFTGRSDGSSKFGGNYTFFPAGSFGWNIIADHLENSSGALSALTFRASYGASGNSEISPYSSLSVLRQFETYVDNVRFAGFRTVTLANDNLEMERTNELNLGLSFGFFRNRLTLDLDYFDQSTNNALLYLPIASSAGIDYALVNGAEISNSGLDASLKYRTLDSRVGWIASLDVGVINNKIDKIEGDLSYTTGTALRGVEDWSLVQTGETIGSFYGYVTDGIVQQGEDVSQIPAFPGQSLQPGDRKYRDINQDDIIDSRDRQVIGTSLPSAVIGFNNTITFAGFDLNIFLQGTMGNDVANFNKLDIENLNGQSNITQEAYDNRWTESSASNDYPAARLTNGAERKFSDAIVEDGSYLRLRHLSLGYTFSGNVIERTSISRLRIHLAANNLATFTGYKGIDPDVGHFGQSQLEYGVDFDGYPKSTQLLFGFELSF